MLLSLNHHSCFLRKYLEYTVKTGENKNGDFMEKRENVLLPLEDFYEEAYGDIRENAVENGRLIKEAFKGSFDIIVKKGYCKGKCVVFANCDGLTNAQRIADYAIKPLLTFQGELPEENLPQYVEKKYKTGEIISFNIVKQSVDARRKDDIHYVYTVDIAIRNEAKMIKRIKNASRPNDKKYKPVCKNKPGEKPVVIAVFGPAGPRLGCPQNV